MSARYSKVISLGEKLRVNCPDNDCRIYLNLFNEYMALESDLNGCLLSKPGRTILSSALERTYLDLERMYFTNYAVRCFRLNNP